MRLCLGVKSKRNWGCDSGVRIEVERQAQKALARLPKQVQTRVAAVIDVLADAPRPAGCRPVNKAERGTYRVRVGDYRVVYVVLDDERVVIVVRVGRRSVS